MLCVKTETFTRWYSRPVCYSRKQRVTLKVSNLIYERDVLPDLQEKLDYRLLPTKMILGTYCPSGERCLSVVSYCGWEKKSVNQNIGYILVIMWHERILYFMFWSELFPLALSGLTNVMSQISVTGSAAFEWQCDDSWRVVCLCWLFSWQTKTKNVFSKTLTLIVTCSVRIFNIITLHIWKCAGSLMLDSKMNQ